MVAMSSGRQVGPDGLPIEVPGTIAPMMPSPSADPPANQAVLDAIMRARSGDNGIESYSALNEYGRAALEPNMSGYFQADQWGNITPRQFSIPEVAQQAGLSSPGQLGQGFTPTGGYGTISYDIPNDRGGFFNANAAGGLPTTGLGLSTNNWRLLGRGPGHIMRQGNVINMNDQNTRFGLPLGVDSSFSDTAESGLLSGKRFVPPGAAFRGINKYGGYYWPGGTMTGMFSYPYATAV